MCSEHKGLITCFTLQKVFPSTYILCFPPACPRAGRRKRRGAECRIAQAVSFAPPHTGAGGSHERAGRARQRCRPYEKNQPDIGRRKACGRPRSSLFGEELQRYVAAGITSDHECTRLEEAVEKIRAGMFIMIREGTAAHNLDALAGLLKPPYSYRCMFATDDKHPGDLLKNGHIDSMVRQAISMGAEPAEAIRMATLYPARYFGLLQKGAVAPGYAADFAVVSELSKLSVEQVWKNGRACI